MFHGQPRDRPVVGFDQGQTRFVEAAQVDRRNPPPGDRPLHGRVLDAHDDPVPLPAVEPVGHRLAHAAILAKNRPGAIRPGVAGDPPEQTAAVPARRFDDQSHLRAAHRKVIVTLDSAKVYVNGRRQARTDVLRVYVCQWSFCIPFLFRLKAKHRWAWRVIPR